METSAAGAVLSRTEYFPHGMVRYTSDGEANHGYSGKERDRVTGLVYFGDRYLDPYSERFIQPAPLFMAYDEGADVDERQAGTAYG